LSGVECRIWEGHTEKGIAMHAYIPILGVRDDNDASEFERDLRKHRQRTPQVEAIPLRMLI
jgi:hypothetical protein